jgi:hypothetical protein
MKKASLCILLLLIAITARAQVEQHPKDITKSGKVFLEACSSVDKQSDHFLTPASPGSPVCFAMKQLRQSKRPSL